MYWATSPLCTWLPNPLSPQAACASMIANSWASVPPPPPYSSGTEAHSKPSSPALYQNSRSTHFCAAQRSRCGNASVWKNLVVISLRATTSSSAHGDRYTGAVTSASLEGEATATDQGLRADIVGFGDAEQVDRACRFGRCAATAQRHHLLHRGEQVRIHPDLDLYACHIDGAVSIGGGFGQPGLDQAERHSVHGDVVPAPFFGQRLRQACDAGFRR